MDAIEPKAPEDRADTTKQSHQNTAFTFAHNWSISVT